MKFLLDVCVASNVLRTTLSDLGHDVLSARDGYASASDRALLDLAYRDERVLVTEDKDFGELVFSLRLPHPCIVRLGGNGTGRAGLGLFGGQAQAVGKVFGAWPPCIWTP